MKRTAVFIENVDGEGPFYCGHTDDLPDLKKGIQNFVDAEVDNWVRYLSPDDVCNLKFTVRLMEDEEIEAIPEC